MAFYVPNPLSMIFLSAFVLCLISLSEEAKNNNGGITVDLIHRDSPLSPFYEPSNTQFQRRMNSFHRSIARSVRLGHFTNTSSAKLSAAAEAPVSPNSGEYLMKILIGTPPVEVVAIADTGSDLTWIQCSPCTNCYKQKPPLFDPTKSKTYQNISCGSKQCQLLSPAVSQCDDDRKNCNYFATYGGGSYSEGDIGAETFTFDSNVEFSKVVFGCGHDNYGSFLEAASGLVGIGGGASSILRQLEKSIGGAKFSYCLTSPDSNVSSRITFGGSAVVEGSKVVSTPLKTAPGETFYYVTLEGFSVGNKRLVHINDSIPESDSESESTNIAIDSGTTLTILPSSIYDELESAVAEAVKGKRVDDPRGVNGLCYESPGNGGFNSPPITAHFEGADVVLPPGSTFVEAAEGVVCLTLVSGGNLSLPIFGNIHQRNYLIGFDLQNQKVNFLPTDCSKPRI
ncbi:hypothetical protein ABFS82_01G047800 [Erythranthe guttata]|uniref:Peptidase A1 domain-containing protein n=1 Tax=Erythranthe guttata TaxID=4155 RepID=A0A022RF06_ERYGU|nr:PREDICTED: aspartic proteinase CDR1-like [Erythranthe guttata]EYU37460.1 hypothetical protein MIMGU_mgv1a026104mg [Erythranthe guttata]|eukprot:XP_012837357.1 PREDICTED: aspartic proteinase CDR1-like [Erythranthe guttata]